MVTRLTFATVSLSVVITFLVLGLIKNHASLTRVFRTPLQTVENVGYMNEIRPKLLRRYAIYLKSSGRLGNHLYKLASAYGIAKINNRVLVVEPAYMEVIEKLLDPKFLPVQVKPIPRKTPYIKCDEQDTKEFTLNMNEKKNVIIGQYVFLYEYIWAYQAEIRERFVIHNELVESSQQFLHGLRELHPQSVTVGIHVRRGDYVTKKRRTIPKSEYLKNAMMYYLSKYTDVHFIVCSEDIEWCQTNEPYLQPGKLGSHYGVHFSTGKHGAPWDMALLAQCNHTIVTVGTFGWWGGWFAGGEVIYFNSTETSDMASEWIAMGDS